MTLPKVYDTSVAHPQPSYRWPAENVSQRFGAPLE
jgi:hypothetical protein